MLQLNTHLIVCCLWILLSVDVIIFFIALKNDEINVIIDTSSNLLDHGFQNVFFDTIKFCVLFVTVKLESWSCPNTHLTSL